MEFQQRYVAYAAAHGKDPESMLEYDEERCPGGCMGEYIIWINCKIREFRDSNPEAFTGTALRDHDAFTAYLFT